MSDYSTLLQYANEDVENLTNRLKDNYPELQLENQDMVQSTMPKGAGLLLSVKVDFRYKGKTYAVEWTYTEPYDDNGIYMDKPLNNLVNQVIQKVIRDTGDKTTAIRHPEQFLASTQPRRSRILAAEGDEGSENLFGDDEDFEDDTGGGDEGLDDALDNIAEQVDDIQDAVEDIEPDDPNIPTDNNIANHYIVECDRCQGIFISALTESEQEVKKISGTCPLCGKETDQYIKWIVRDIHDTDDQDMI